MRIGLLTNALAHVGVNDLRAVAGWARETGFAALEVGPTVEADARLLAAVRGEFEMEITALIFCRNFQEAERGRELREMLLRKIATAGEAQVPVLTTSTGSLAELTFAENVGEFRDLFTPILAAAADANVTIAFENCPETGNIATTPFAWHDIFEVFPQGTALCFDPSHLVWQFSDPYLAAEHFCERIAYLHAKDTEIVAPPLAHRDIKRNRDWWRYRVPGRGLLDWRRLLGTLSAAGFDGTLSIEHEDPDLSGSEAAVKQGLLEAKRHLDAALEGL